ncbi:AarF/UbiB family protein [Providencia alcalifaciens]|uniref:AarF/UbiB family protein n=1 Tax=Providencia alcalifaciens TaxID=126385 RepID=UPI001CC528A5|nr:hypothetical protein NVI2019_GHJFPKLH_03279 [Providencia alcalifaciens]
MVQFSSYKINIRTDTLQSAISKKSDNHKLSSKTLDKLQKIINSQFQLNVQEIDHILGHKQISRSANQKAISQFISQISGITANKKSCAIYHKLAVWKENAQTLIQTKKHQENGEKSIGNGARGRVYRSGDSVIKKFKTFDPIAAQHEISMCNLYNFKSNNPVPNAVIINNTIKMPFIEGKVPTAIEIRDGIAQLHEKGFFIADAKPANFLVTEDNKIVPVDFGLMFTAENLISLDKNIKIEIVRDYIKGGYRCIPSELKPAYIQQIKQLDQRLSNDSPVRSLNIKELKKSGFM